ncbi:hypothetical protein V6Z11_A06G223400 [Gossypium hirsutum]|uniref:Uncharacterized protein n=1 Tax=Gossypium hirsutum TaxID=3635 RepID=A0ABM3BYT2_GOSHI|nr:uncharacterized protein LOC121230822 [Gossypium hirsutum]
MSATGEGSGSSRKKQRVLASFASTEVDSDDEVTNELKEACHKRRRDHATTSGGVVVTVALPAPPIDPILEELPPGAALGGSLKLTSPNGEGNTLFPWREQLDGRRYPYYLDDVMKK